MIAYLIGKNRINKLVLPRHSVGNYVIKEDENNLVNIEGNGIDWQISSNQYTRIINPESVIYQEDNIYINNINNIMDKVSLKEYCIYTLIIGSSNEVYTLYTSPVCDKTYIQVERKITKELLIGRGEQNHIQYHNNAISDVHAKLSLKDDKWVLENFDRKIGTYVNGTPVNKDIRVLLNGDVIFILGLKIIVMGNMFFINNPINQITLDNKIFDIITPQTSDSQYIAEEENDTELYKDNDYYFRAPRIKNKIECETIRIDPPPANEKREEMPMALVLGSTISMSAIMLTSVFSSIQGIKNGTKTTTENILSLVVAFAMLISMILFPILERKWQKRQKIKYEKKRQVRYKEYIDSKVNEIDQVMEKQTNLLFQNFPSTEECLDIILSKNTRLWERKIEDYDFLTLKLGIGDIPSEIKIEYPEKQFTMDDDNLVDMLNTVANKSKILKSVPITLSLAEQNITGIISDNNLELRRYIQELIVQLITFHSYTDLKLVFLLNENDSFGWKHFQLLPHVWSNIKDIRFFSDEMEEIKEISRYLEEVIANRKEKESNKNDYKSFSPYYLIITDDYKKIERINIINEIVNSKENLGFGMLCIADNLTNLPNECKAFVQIKNGKGEKFESELTEDSKRYFTFDNSQRVLFEKILSTLSNIPIRLNESKSMLLPNSYTFLEMYDVGNIEQLNVYERWKNSDTTLSLKAPIGIDGSGMKIYLDIHEKYHGPHGLIAGSTGSGKSEFIISYILSLAINYHPDDLAFILIDYKGGGLAGAFQKRDIKLPHLVGTITNIEKTGLQRSLASIQSELRRRQILFNEARNKTDEGTIDIYKYQKLYHDGTVSKPIPHLLIICDEFAELKQQQDDFMDELISVARIGRSLGVHLILATQKPAGVVDDQIRSNSKFGICLKVQDKSDSEDVIGKPDAAYLKNVGQFYMRVGNDEFFTLGQSAWTGANYIPSNAKKKKEDKSIEFISSMGTTIKRIDDALVQEENSQGEQLTNIVKYLDTLAKNEKIYSEQLWLDNIPENIYLEDLKKKYKSTKENVDVEVLIGEYDDPENQKQGIVKLNLTQNGNAIIYGSADSGKETLLSTFIYDTMTTYSTDEAQLYVIDFGSEALKIFKDSPSVGDVIFASDEEKLSRYFKMIEKEIKVRKAILSEFSGDYELYLKTSGKSMPLIINIINSYETFMEMYEAKYEDMFLTFTREGYKYGIVFIITVTSSSDIRYRLSQNFKQKISLKVNNDDDYYNIFDNIGKKRPSNLFGRGMIPLEDGEIYEFQTAKICEPQNWNIHIKQTIDNLNKQCKHPARPIPTIPKRIPVKSMERFLTDISKLPLGIDKENLELCFYNFIKRKVNLVISKNIEDGLAFSVNLIEEIKMLKNIELFILDAENVFKTNKKDIENEYARLSIRLNQDNSKPFVAIILGLDKFINNLDSTDIEFNEMLKKTDSIENVSFIIVENLTKAKSHEYDDWYKNYISKENGIWVGNGLDDQYLFDLNSARNIPNNVGSSYGFVIESGKYKLVKLIGIKDKEDEDEQ